MYIMIVFFIIRLRFLIILGTAKAQKVFFIMSASVPYETFSFVRVFNDCRLRVIFM